MKNTFVTILLACLGLAAAPLLGNPPARSIIQIVRDCNEPTTIDLLLNQIESGANINEVDEKGQNALMMLTPRLSEGGGGPSSYGVIMELPMNRSIAHLLLLAGIDVDARDKYGNTPLILAARERSTELIVTLIRMRADVNAESEDGTTALQESLGNIKSRMSHNTHHNSGTDALIAEKLIRAGAHAPHAREAIDMLNQILHENAALVGFESLKSLKTTLEATLNQQPQITQPAPAVSKENTDADLLIQAIRSNNFALLRHLISARHNINARDKKGITPLLTAIVYGRFEMVQELIKNGVDLEAPELNEGASPLIISARWGKLSITKLLIQAGAHVNARAKYCTTALCMSVNCLWSSSIDRLETAKALIDAGADVTLVPDVQEDVTLTPHGFGEGYDFSDGDNIRPSAAQCIFQQEELGDALYKFLAPAQAKTHIKARTEERELAHRQSDKTLEEAFRAAAIIRAQEKEREDQIALLHTVARIRAEQALQK